MQINKSLKGQLGIRVYLQIILYPEFVLQVLSFLFKQCLVWLTLEETVSVAGEVYYFKSSKYHTSLNFINGGELYIMKIVFTAQRGTRTMDFGHDWLRNEDCSRMEVSYCTFGFGAFVRRNLRTLCLLRVLPRNNLNAWVI